MGRSAFDELDGIEPQPIWEGLLARAVHGERITLAVVELEPNCILPEHSHENEQLGIVLRGSLAFRVGSEERLLGPGGTWRIEPNTPHYAEAGPDGAVVIDVFGPPRADWEAIERLEPRPPRWP
jgi:quercetin dioxygenase-like cupin family protein